MWNRRTLILAGGGAYAAALLLCAVSRSFALLLLASLLLYPASGAFVSLSQATLVDGDPGRQEQSMALWNLAGSLGVVGGPLALTAILFVGGGWRALFAGMSVCAFLTLVLAWQRLPSGRSMGGEEQTLIAGMRRALLALRRVEVVRWLVLLECANLTQDVLFGYLALYFVDVVGLTAIQAGVAVAVWIMAGLLGSVILIPLLERVPGLLYVRWTALSALIIFPGFLLVPGLVPKVALLGLLGLLDAGWYPVLQGRLYAALPGQSGIVLTLSTVFALLPAAILFALGLAAQRFGLGVAVWLLLAGPVALSIALPSFRESPRPAS